MTVNNPNDNPDAESNKFEQSFNVVQKEIQELIDWDVNNDEIKNIDGLLTSEFSSKITKEQASDLLAQIDDYISKLWGNEPQKEVADLKRFLLPIASWSLNVNWSEGLDNIQWNDGKNSRFYNNVDKTDWENQFLNVSATKTKIDEIKNSIWDINDAELIKLKGILEKISAVLDHPSTENVRNLQKVIYSNLNEDQQKVFKRNNRDKNNPKEFDWKFGKHTLTQTDELVWKIKNRVDEIKASKDIQNTHEQINTQREQEAEAERQRIDAQKQKEQNDVTTLVGDINTNVSKEKEYIDQLNVQTVFANYPLRGVWKIDRAITKLKHINDVQKQAEDLKNERDRLNSKLNTSKELLNNSENKRWKRFAEKQIRTYEAQIHEINVKYNELKNQEDLKTPIEEKIRTQLSTIKSEYESQFNKLNEKVNRLKWVNLSDFWDGISDEAKNLILKEQENRVNTHKSEIDKYNRDMNSILSFLWSKYEWWKLVDDPNNTTPFEKFINKYGTISIEGADISQDDLNTIIGWLKDKNVSTFWEVDNEWNFKFNEWVLVTEWTSKYVKYWEHKFQLCDKNTNSITSSLVCLVSGGALYFASYKDWKVSSDWALLHSASTKEK